MPFIFKNKINKNRVLLKTESSEIGSESGEGVPSWDEYRLTEARKEPGEQRAY